MTSDPQSRTLLRLAAQVERYRRDFPRFAEEILKIVPKSGGLTAFRLHPYQARVHAAVREQEQRLGFVRQCWLKNRQIGTSTLTQGIVFHRTVLTPFTSAIVVAHDTNTAQLIFTMARRFYDNLPPALKPMLRYSTKSELIWDNPKDTERAGTPGMNSKIVVATARNVHTGAGGTYQVAHLSEAARFVDPMEIEASTLQTVPNAPGTIVIIESTARPEGHWFKQKCDDAVNKSVSGSLYDFHFIGWTEDPTCRLLPPLDEPLEPDPEELTLATEFGLGIDQLYWRRIKIADLGRDLFNQEYPTRAEDAWVLREWLVFPREQVHLTGEAVGPPRERHAIMERRQYLDETGPLAVWEPPQAGAAYALGADVAMGVAGGDWSVAQVVRLPDCAQVAEYRAQLDPGSFAEVIDTIGRWYHNALVSVEINGPGLHTNNELNIRLGYPNLYLFRRPDRLKNQISNFLGWQTTVKTKQHLVARARDILYRWSKGPRTVPLVRSQLLWREMAMFVQDPGTETCHAGPGAHDDCVMAWMIALQAASDDLGGTGLGEVSAEPVTPTRVIDPALVLQPHEVPGGRAATWHEDPWQVVGWS